MKTRYCLCIIWTAVMAVFASSNAYAEELVLALANSTCNAMKQVGDLYRTGKQVDIRYICKSSGLLAKGLRGKSISAHIFVSADSGWMDFAIDNELVAPGQAISPWGNSLVIGVSKNSALSFESLQDLATDKVNTILIGDPSTAPFGRYAKEALENSGLWDRVKVKIRTRKNIELLAESLAKAAPGTVGILFMTNLGDDLRPAHLVDKKLHKPIRYYIAPLKSAAGNEDATDFLRFLQSRKAQELLQAARFDIGTN